MIEIMTKQPETGRGSSYELYDRVSEPLTRLMGGSVGNIKQLVNLIWLVVAVINGESIALSQLATQMPGGSEARSRVTRVREWLKNQQVDVWALYQLVLRHVLQNWRGTSLSLIVDGTMVFGDRRQIVRVSLAHSNRAIPLAWIVVPGTGLVKIERLEPLFRRVAEFLKPYRANIILLADRGFRDHDLAVLCLDLGWGYRIRIARNTHIRVRTGTTVRLDTLKPKKGHTLCVCHAVLTQAEVFVTNVTMTWSRGEGSEGSELVIVMSDQPAHPDRLCEYAVRMAIEQSFRDDKSGGFDIGRTRLIHPERLERLLLAVAIATLWCYEVGQFVLLKGETHRRLIDPARTRHLSVFQLGLRWIKRCLAVMLDSLQPFTAILDPWALPPVRLRKT